MDKGIISLYERGVEALEQIKSSLDEHTSILLEDYIYYVDVALNVALANSLDNQYMANSIFRTEKNGRSVAKLIVERRVNDRREESEE